jgi:hypothetical protein
VEQDLILQVVRYERRNFEQKDQNSLIGKERKTKQSLWDRIPRLYHFHESPSMRYTFAPTSTLCPIDCARTPGAETGWCFAGSRKSGFSVNCFFFSSSSFTRATLDTLPSKTKSIPTTPRTCLSFTREGGAKMLRETKHQVEKPSWY